MDVGVRAVLSGWTEAQKQIGGTAESLEKLAAANKKVEASTSPAGKAVQGLTGGFKEGAATADLLSVRVLALGGVIGTALAGSAVMAGKAFLDGFNQVKEYGDQLANLAQRTGISAERLSGLRLAAETNNMTIQQFAQTIQMFNRGIDQARDGTGRQAEAFNRLDISIRNVDGSMKTNEQLLAEVANRFSTMKDGADKTTLAMDLFGRSGTNLIPILNEGAAGLAKLEAEAKAAGITMTEETVKAAKEYNEHMRVLKAHAEGFWMNIATPILKGMAEITKEMRQAKLEGESWIGTMMRGANQFLSGFGLGLPGQTDAQRRDALVVQLQRRYESLASAQSRGDTPMANSLMGEIGAMEEERNRLNAILAITNPTPKFTDDGGAPVFTPGAPTDEAAARRAQQIEARRHGPAEDFFLQEKIAAQKFYTDFLIRETKRRTDQASQEEIDSQVQVFDFERQLGTLRAQEQADAAGEVADFWAASAQERIAREKEVHSVFGESTMSSLEVFKGFAAAVQGVNGELLQGHVNLSRQMTQIWRGLWNSMVSEAARIMTKSMLEPVMKPFREVFEDTGNWVRNNVFSPLWDFIKTGFSDLTSWLSTIDWGKTFSSMVSLFASAAGIFGEFFSADFFAATGLDIVVTKPTKIIAGEAGPEHVKITPIGGGGLGGGMGEGGVQTESRNTPAGARALGRMAVSVLSSMVLGKPLGVLGLLNLARKNFLDIEQEDFEMAAEAMRNAYAEFEGLMDDLGMTSNLGFDMDFGSFDPGGEFGGGGVDIGTGDFGSFDPGGDFGGGDSSSSDGGASNSDDGGQSGGMGFQTGGEFMATRPRTIKVAETGPEKVRITPLDGTMGGDRPANGTFITVNGPLVMDDYSQRRFRRWLNRG